MANEPPEITLKAIGIVSNRVKRAPNPGYNWQRVISRITVDSSPTEALDGLEAYSHLIVLYWMHQATDTKLTTKIHPMGKEELPLTGLFATRTPYRPNPIGKTTVRLIERRGSVLTVKGLDAISGTPVIDIKPYIPGYDSVAKTKAPPWTTKR